MRGRPARTKKNGRGRPGSDRRMQSLRVSETILGQFVFYEAILAICSDQSKFTGRGDDKPDVILVRDVFRCIGTEMTGGFDNKIPSLH